MRLWVQFRACDLPLLQQGGLCIAQHLSCIPIQPLMTLAFASTDIRTRGGCGSDPRGRRKILNFHNVMHWLVPVSVAFAGHAALQHAPDRPRQCLCCHSENAHASALMCHFTQAYQGPPPRQLDPSYSSANTREFSCLMQCPERRCLQRNFLLLMPSGCGHHGASRQP